MPPRIRIQASSQALAFRPKQRQPQWHTRPFQATRSYADKSTDLPKSTETDGKGPNMDQLPHVSEEAAATKQTMGEQGPDISGQGTPVQEVLRTPYDAQYDEYLIAGEQVLQGDKEAQKNLPKVMQDDIKKASGSSNKRSFSTFVGARRHYSTTARRQASDLSTYQGNAVIPPEMIYHSPAYAAFLSRFPASVRENALTTLPESQPETAIAEENMPERPLHQHRYDPIVEQMVGLMIRHGKKSVAQRNMTHILSTLRTSPPPTIDARHPLLPGSPPAQTLPLNPVLYLQLAIDSVAPLMRVKSIRGAAGGGMALQLPTPLGQRQRRRVAMKWILDAAAKKKGRGSGKTGFAQRVAEEVIAVIEGKSGVWERRGGVHKMGVSARANLNARTRRR